MVVISMSMKVFATLLDVLNCISKSIYENCVQPP